MAKQSVRKATAQGRIGPPPMPSFDERFPTIARWISKEEGWVELGADHASRSLVRALYGGGMVWEGKASYESLDEALRAMEGGIAAWLEVNRPDGGRGGMARKKPSPAAPGRSVTRKKMPPKAPAPPKSDERVEPDPTTAVPRAFVEKVRKLAELAEALREGRHFEITRLTTIKGLCKEPRAAWRFALFLAEHAGEKVAQGRCPERSKALAARIVSAMGEYMEKPSPERGSRLRALVREVEAEQDETRRVGWNQVRMIRNRDLLVIEHALRSIVFIAEAPTWLYQAARDYAERYDPRHGTGLIPSSSPMVREIADFWREFFGICL